MYIKYKLIKLFDILVRQIIFALNIFAFKITKIGIKE